MSFLVGDVIWCHLVGDVTGVILSWWCHLMSFLVDVIWFHSWWCHLMSLVMSSMSFLVMSSDILGDVIDVILSWCPDVILGGDVIWCHSWWCGGIALIACIVVCTMKFDNCNIRLPHSFILWTFAIIWTMVYAVKCETCSPNIYIYLSGI